MILTQTKKRQPQRLPLYTVRRKLLLFLEPELLYVDSFLMSHTLDHGRLLKVLAGAHLADGTGLFELALEFLQGSLDIFAFFDGNDDHAFTPPFSQLDRKVRNYLKIHKIFC